jgi:hypothetical protein
VRSAVSLLGAEATEWFDETFGPAKPVEHVEVSQWGQVRPRPTRGLGGGKQRLETADPRYERLSTAPSLMMTGACSEILSKLLFGLMLVKNT